MKSLLVLMPWVLFGLTILLSPGKIWAQSCPDQFKASTRPVSVQVLYRPNQLLKNITSLGQMMQQVVGDQPFQPNTMVPKRFYSAFFKRALVLMQDQQKILAADIESPDSVYGFIKADIQKLVLPRFDRIQQKINHHFDFAGGVKGIIAIEDLMGLSNEVSDLLNYQSTEQLYGVFQRMMAHKNFSHFNLDESKKLLTAYNQGDQKSRKALFLDFIKSSTHLLGNEADSFGAFKLFLVVHEVGAKVAMSKPITPIEYRATNYLPYLSWSMPSEWTQLKAKTNRVHVLTFAAGITGFDGLRDVYPSYSSLHDWQHLISAYAGSSGAAEADPQAFQKWLGEFKAFVDHFEELALRQRLSDLDIYLAIHYIATLSHEYFYDHSVDLPTYRHLVIDATKGEYGELRFLQGDIKDLVEQGEDLLRRIIRSFYINNPSIPKPLHL